MIIRELLEKAEDVSCNYVALRMHSYTSASSKNVEDVVHYRNPLTEMYATPKGLTCAGCLSFTHHIPSKWTTLRIKGADFADDETTFSSLEKFVKQLPQGDMLQCTFHIETGHSQVSCDLYSRPVPEYDFLTIREKGSRVIDAFFEELFGAAFQERRVLREHLRSVNSRFFESEFLLPAYSRRAEDLLMPLISSRELFSAHFFIQAENNFYVYWCSSSQDELGRGGFSIDAYCLRPEDEALFDWIFKTYMKRTAIGLNDLQEFLEFE
ncbi:hypothetical protein D6774_04915 [Candidatus Woesearchaeota archaeon]|nr:MAG: hypothetical protein D6774_04915 [Candidatus Woesearchaeota archaeon]